MITLEYYQKAKEHLKYDPSTGDLIWKQRPSNRVCIGDRAGHFERDYYHVRITCNRKGKLVANHRIAWFIYYGEIPEFIDHMNGNKTDNRVSNLRVCTKSENAYNSKKRADNTSGYKGVCWNKESKKWQANITANKKQMYLGLFDTALKAHKAYRRAADKYHGEFKRYA